MSNIASSRICKAKRKDGYLIVELDGTDNDTERQTVVKCRLDKVHPDIATCFQALSDSVREVLEWPSNLYTDTLGYQRSTDAVDVEAEHSSDRINVTGVSWSYSESTDVEGACIVFQVNLEQCTSPFCGTTPHLPYGQYSEDGNQPVMPDGAQDALNALKEEVKRFLDGKRAQGDLFIDGLQVGDGKLYGPYPVTENV
jgi:hypothetical protein